MITEVYGDIFETDAKAIVNPVNCVGVMGKGLALEFKKRYPKMFKEYQKICEMGSLEPGILHYYTGEDSEKTIINFPTKRHWNSPSKIEYIAIGLSALSYSQSVKQINIESLAIPALGCGCGELDWKDVRKLIYSNLSDMNIPIFIYPPH